MKRWWELWLGHVLVGLCLGMLLLSGYFMWQSMRSIESDAMFLWFICAGIAFVLAVVVGALAAWKFNTSVERRYIRYEAGMAGDAVYARRSDQME